MEERRQAEGEVPPDGELAKAFALLTSHGYAVRRKAGQAVIQIVRQREAGEFAWRYHVNKYERRLYSPKGKEFEFVVLSLDKVPWQKCDPDPKDSE